MIVGIPSPGGGPDKEKSQETQVSDREGDEKEDPSVEILEKEAPSGNGPASKGTGRRRYERSSLRGSRPPEKREGREEERLVEGAEDTPGGAPTRSTGRPTREAGSPGAQPVDRGSDLESPDTPGDPKKTGPGGPMVPGMVQPGGRQMYLVQGPSTEGANNGRNSPNRRPAAYRPPVKPPSAPPRQPTPVPHQGERQAWGAPAAQARRRCHSPGPFSR